MATRGRERRLARRAARKPQQQYYGGSAEAVEAARQRYRQAGEQASGMVRQGLAIGQAYTDVAQKELGYDSLRTREMGLRQEGLSAQAGQQYDQSFGDYRAGREGLLTSAGRLESTATADADEIAALTRGLSSSFQRSSEAQFRATQDANQRAAQSLAAGRGASGLRAALASSTAANAQAAAQAEIARAQETNQLAAMQQQGLATAAGLRQQGLSAGASVRGGLSAQDLQASQIAQGVRAQADAYTLAASQQAAAISAQRAAIGQQQAAAQTSAGLTLQGNYLGAETGVDTAQLGADSAHQANRIAFREQQRKYVTPAGWLGLN